MRFTPLLSLKRVPALGLLGLVLATTGCASRTVLGPQEGGHPADAAALDPSKGAQTSTVTQLQKFMWFFSPYRPDIQQGNFVSQEMLAKLKEGMTREQVSFVLGTPLLADIFHAERWDYPFRMAKGNGELTVSTVVVYFDKDGKVARWEGGNLPTEQEYIARIAGPVKQFAKEQKRAAENTMGDSKAPLPAGTDSSAARPVEVTPPIKQ
ncbi:outer membrane protein assembly factor BamE [Massilia sp. SM-13]|uniref:outer membrane protein assembly factor BamE n=1 Tax=Pseudoduganella rhizocola TaxID=3382643 RepID=UPI0038B5C87C